LQNSLPQEEPKTDEKTSQEVIPNTFFGSAGADPRKSPKLCKKAAEGLSKVSTRDTPQLAGIDRRLQKSLLQEDESKTDPKKTSEHIF
jgi:hypothetical protein